jgi:hypothetical protein
MTIFIFSLSVFNIITPRFIEGLHISVSPERFKTPSVVLILCPARAFSDVRKLSASELLDDLGRISGVRINRKRAGIASQGAIPLSISVVVIEGDGGYFFSMDIFPDVQLCPVQEGMNANVGSGSKIGLELVPELWRLISQIPNVLLVPRREIPLLGP